MTPQTPSSGCTEKQWQQRQRQQAEALAPAGPVSEVEFRRALRANPLSVVRLAAIRYSGARGHSYALVIDRFVEVLQNPYVNHGDDYRIALGHVEATRRYLAGIGRL